MNRSFRSIAVFSLSTLGLCAAGIPNAMATTPSKVAIFQCNLFTNAVFNLESYDKSTNTSISLPSGATSSCAELVEQLMYLGLTNVNVSYTSVSNGTSGNYETFTMSDGTVAGI